jgi:site-specific DNA recombinase
VNKRLRPQIEVWQQERAGCAPVHGLLDLTGDDALDKWLAAPLDVKRAAIDLLMNVRILPVGSGKRRDPTSVEIIWKR